MTANSHQRIFLAVLLYAVLFSAVLSLAACTRTSRDETDEPESNILKEYIRTPIDRANAVDDQMNERNKRLADALNE